MTFCLIIILQQKWCFHESHRHPNYFSPPKCDVKKHKNRSRNALRTTQRCKLLERKKLFCLQRTLKDRESTIPRQTFLVLYAFHSATRFFFDIPKLYLIAPISVERTDPAANALCVFETGTL